MNKILYPTENKSTMNNQFKPGDAVKLKISDMQMMIRGVANIPSEQESIAKKKDMNVCGMTMPNCSVPFFLRSF
jgi:hypothetical protein